jgi:pyrroline-5-carboxylate reductase
MPDIALIGFGAIGQALARSLVADPLFRITQIIVPARSVDRVGASARQFSSRRSGCSSSSISPMQDVRRWSPNVPVMTRCWRMWSPP